MTNRNPDATLKPGKVAARLAIDYHDLPWRDGPWTKRAEARRRYGTRKEREARERRDYLDSVFTERGWNAPDEGTVEQACIYALCAVLDVTFATDCSYHDAESAAERRWPKSMAAEEAYDGSEDW